MHIEYQIYRIVMALSLLYQNVRGLRTKVDALRIGIENSDADVICLTETWLNNDFDDGEFMEDNWISYRKDRSVSGVIRGGGCMVIHSKFLKSMRVSEFESDIDFVDDVWIRFEIPSGYFYLCTVYITSKQNNTDITKSFLDKMNENLMKLNSTDRVLIVGDFNIRNIDWVFSDNGLIIPINVNDEKAVHLLNSINLGNLNQFNGIFNKDNKILDLVLSNDDSKTIEIVELKKGIVNIDYYHPPIEIHMQMELKYMDEIEHRKFNFRKANYNNLSNSLSTIDWSFLHTLNVNDAVNSFYSIINKIILDLVPPYKTRKRFPFWYSRDLISLIKKKDKLRAKWRRSKRQCDYSVYSVARAQSKIQIDDCYGKYLVHLQENMRSNVKLFWSYAKKKRQSNSYPNTFKLNDMTASSPQEACELFSTQFKSVVKPTNTGQTTFNTTNTVRPQTANPIYISPRSVELVLSQLDVNKNGGPDGIPNIFWKNLHCVLAYPLSILYNKSLDTGIYPVEFKKAYVTPIFKSGDKQLISNYRPVSLLNTISLVFEKLVLYKFRPMVAHTISPFQHGFSPGKSTNTNLMEYVDYIADGLDNGMEVHAVYTDFAKAFDWLNHPKILFKLEKLGISGKLLDWFRSYLTDRHLQVSFGGHKSATFSPSSGVPQGSVLGPFLFNLYINDLCHQLKCNYLLFADDLKLYKTITTLDDSIELQNDLNALHFWCVENDIKLNIDKCKFIAFNNKSTMFDVDYHINHQVLEMVEEIKDLGVIIDRKLRFDQHINSMVNKAYKMLGFISRVTKDFTNMKCINMLYNSLVRSNLEYCASVWNPHHTIRIQQLEKVQKKYTRHVWFKLHKPYENYEMRLKNLQMFTLEMRREYYDLCSLYAIVNGNFVLGNKLVIRDNHYNSRKKLLFHPPVSRTDFGRFVQPSMRLQYLFNNKVANQEIIYLPKKKFVVKLKRELFVRN